MKRTKAEVAGRNWTKRRLLGICLDIRNMTEKEKEIYFRMMELKKSLLDNWDSESEIFLGHPLPRYKCTLCGKRIRVPYLHNGKEYCKNCYTDFLSLTQNVSIIRTNI